MKQLSHLSFGLIMALLFSTPAHTTLLDWGGGLIYDDDIDITWLQDANYAKTSGYDADGKMTWQEAVTWVNNLVYVDPVTGISYDDWRLPVDPTLCTGSTCLQSEFWHLYNVEGISLFPPPNTGPFINLSKEPFPLRESTYWTGTSGIGFPSNLNAIYFDTYTGNQGFNYKYFEFYVWPVRNGSPVPEPGTFLLFGIGIAGFAAVGRRRKK